MDGMDLHGKGIRDEEIHDSAPLVRALLVQRLEQIWTTCEPQITGVAGKPDPRFIEAGLRTLKHLGEIYRLSHPVPSQDRAPGELEAPAQRVLDGLLELESRMRDAVS